MLTEWLRSLIVKDKELSHLVSVGSVSQWFIICKQTIPYYSLRVTKLAEADNNLIVGQKIPVWLKRTNYLATQHLATQSGSVVYP